MNMAEAERTDFIRGIRSQTDKLDFLFQALVKTSRLETGVIRLDKKPERLFDTVAQAMSGIVYAAEKKKITVSADCPEDLTVSHDSKRTTEPLFNLSDNAVKYTPAGGKIAVSVVLWEMYVEIKAADTGKGISESKQASIFRRNIGFIFQNYNLVPILNVYENIVLPVELDGNTVDQKFLDEIVHLPGLEDKLKNMPNNLSGGQQQRVTIALVSALLSAIVLYGFGIMQEAQNPKKKTAQIMYHAIFEQVNHSTANFTYANADMLTSQNMPYSGDLPASEGEIVVQESFLDSFG